MSYWLDLFTGTTWREFREAGAKISGFSVRRRNVADRVKSGDILLCYLTGVMRWVGALEVTGRSNNTDRIWKDQEFPVRFSVNPLIMLEPEHGIPMEQLQGRVKFFETLKDKGKFRGFVRASPNPFQDPKDAELILTLLKDALRAPVSRPVDPKKLARKPLYRVEPARGGTKQAPVLVSVPESDEISSARHTERSDTIEPSTTRHTEIQYELLTLGAELGLDVWVARNDRHRKWNNIMLGTMPKIVDELPTQFNEATNRTIELIDVLWLSGNSIVAAFEIECTTSIYSGLLRMSDLLALQPNLDINLFLVAPDERRDKVEQELLRPSFSLRDKPLSKACGFLPFGKLCELLAGIRKLGLGGSLKASFLKSTAEYFNADDDLN
jgi:hypothetical protein